MGAEDKKEILYLTSPIPPSVNHYLSYRIVKRGGRYIPVSYKTKEAVSYQNLFKETAMYEAVRQGWKKPESKSQHIYIVGDFYFERRGQDPNNYWKVLLDAITMSGNVWLDDDVVCVRDRRILYDPKNPRIEMAIMPVQYIGIFDNAAQLEVFETNCLGCNRYNRNCSILRKAREGFIQDEVSKDKICLKYKKRKGN